MLQAEAWCWTLSAYISTRYTSCLELSYNNKLQVPFLGSDLHRHAGEAIFGSEQERIVGQLAKRTSRLAAAARRRSRPLALTFSATMAACYLVLSFSALGFEL